MRRMAWLCAVCLLGSTVGCGSAAPYDPAYLVQTEPSAFPTASPTEVTAAETQLAESGIAEAEPTETVPAETVLTEVPAAETTTVPLSTETLTETQAATGIPALLTAPEDIGLRDTDGEGHSYTFTYGEQEFRAVYTKDNWKIIDSYQIRSSEDMVIICQALKAEHPIPSADYQSERTAEDMAYEWQQHNLAYALLSDDSPWKQNAKDVDINPADQGKSVYELYQDRLGGSNP